MLDESNGLADIVHAAILEDPELGKDARLSVDIKDPTNDGAIPLIPAGSRLDLKKPHCSADQLHKYYARAAAEAVESKQVLHVRLRPFGSNLAMPLRKKDVNMFNDKRWYHQFQSCLSFLLGHR